MKTPPHRSEVTGGSDAGVSRHFVVRLRRFHSADHACFGGFQPELCAVYSSSPPSLCIRPRNRVAQPTGEPGEVQTDSIDDKPAPPQQMARQAPCGHHVEHALHDALA